MYIFIWPKANWRRASTFALASSKERYKNEYMSCYFFAYMQIFPYVQTFAHMSNSDQVFGVLDPCIDCILMVVTILELPFAKPNNVYDVPGIL